MDVGMSVIKRKIKQYVRRHYTSLQKNLLLALTFGYIIFDPLFNVANGCLTQRK